MKTLGLLVAMLFNGATFSEDYTEHEHDHDHARPFTPEEEEAYFTPFENGLFRKRRFPYTYWNECSKPITGNYQGYSCTSIRRISEILFDFMDTHLGRCVEEAASTIGWVVEDYHITHKGIYGDRNHSSRSLHAEGRAIDISAISLTLSDGRRRKLDYKSYAGGKFFSKLRSCWGSSVMQYNNCPSYNGVRHRTGSIGSENHRHKYHLHLSVPYCISGRYAGHYYRR